MLRVNDANHVDQIRLTVPYITTAQCIVPVNER